VRVRCFAVRRNGLVSASIAAVAAWLAENAYDSIQNLGAIPDFELAFHPRLLGMVAQIHCEKWVEEVGAHCSLYSGAMDRYDAPALASPVGVTGEGLILKNKVFSGDVSGTIGEALFSLFLTGSMGVSDFLIFSRTRSLDDLLGSGPPSAEYPFPAEVKSVSSPMPQLMAGRIEGGLAQLIQFWGFRRRSVPSVLAIAARNVRLTSYDLFLMIVRE
jgi:hypothetical protein